MNGFVEILGILEHESDDTGSLLMLRSHPYLKDRIAAVQQEKVRVQEKYQKDLCFFFSQGGSSCHSYEKKCLLNLILNQNNVRIMNNI